MSGWEKFKEELGKLLASLVAEVQSRKFRAFMVVILGVLIAYFNGEVEPNVALYTIIVDAVAYIMGIAVEDGLKGGPQMKALPA